MENVGTIATATPPWTLRFARAHRSSISTLSGELVAVLLLSVILLSVALWNGFPIIFYDTGAYILEGLGHVWVPERAPVYSLLLDFAGGGYSLWLIAVLQAAISAFVITEVARAEIPDLSIWLLALIVAALVLITGIGWYAAEIEPDSLTAIMVLALYLLAFRFDVLGTTRTILLVGVAALGAAVHSAHLALAGGLILLLLLARLATKVFPSIAVLRPAIFSSLGSFVLALVLVFSANYDLTQKWFVNRTGPYFLFARMLQDGIVQRVLTDSCPTTHYVFCKFKDHLPNRADAWLWDGNSPFNALDRFHGRTGDYDRVIIEGFERYPLLNLAAAIKDTAVQFVKIRTGDQIEPQEWILYSDLAHYLPGQMNAYMGARQQKGELRFGSINRIHLSVGVASLIALLLLLWSAAVSGDRRAGVLPAFVLVSLLGNAFICGVLSNPHDRYQSRLIWVPAFVAALSMTQFRGRVFSLQKTIESGT